MRRPSKGWLLRHRKEILISGMFLDSPTPGAELSKTCVCGLSFAVIAVSSPAGGLHMSLVSVECCQVESLRRADHSSREVVLS